jgi:hypothetical protein
MKGRTRGIHLSGVCTRKYEYAAKQRECARNSSVWLQPTYRMYVSAFSFKAGTTKCLVETTPKGKICSAVRIELWRARIRTGYYQVNGQALAVCILIKEAHFFQL